MPCIEARGLRKAFGATLALDGVNLRVEEGRILGLIGPNGACKTTALNAILGLTPYQGELTVLGRDPWTERDRLMLDVCGHRCHIIDHSAAERGSTAGERCPRRDAIRSVVAVPNVADAALSPCHGALALARAHLRLAPAQVAVRTFIVR